MPKRFNSLRVEIILALFSVLFTIACIEGGSRFVVFLKYGHQNQGFHHVFKYETFLVTRTNERFLQSYPPKVDRFRILILGGSTADQFSSLSQEAFAQVFSGFTTEPIEVINFAQGGFISSQELVMFARYGVRLKPDLVIVIDGANDIISMTKNMPAGIPYTDAFVQLAMNHPFLNALIALGRHSQFVNILRKLGERKIERSLQSDDRAVNLVISEYLTNHKLMQAMAYGVGTRFVSVLQPYLHLREEITAKEKTLLSISNYAYRKEFMMKTLRRFGSELSHQKRDGNAYFVDSTTAFDSSTEDCFVDEVHLTERGKALFLQHLVKQLHRE